MVVMVLERVPPGLRGELTRWMLEPAPGVFVGTLSALVRDKLWGEVCGKMKGGAGILAYNTDNEQGFTMKVAGETRRVVRDFDGLLLLGIAEG